MLSGLPITIEDGRSGPLTSGLAAVRGGVASMALPETAEELEALCSGVEQLTWKVDEVTRALEFTAQQREAVRRAQRVEQGADPGAADVHRALDVLRQHGYAIAPAGSDPAARAPPAPSRVDGVDTAYRWRPKPRGPAKAEAAAPSPAEAPAARSSKPTVVVKDETDAVYHWRPHPTAARTLKERRWRNALKRTGFADALIGYLGLARTTRAVAALPTVDTLWDLVRHVQTSKQLPRALPKATRRMVGALRWRCATDHTVRPWRKVKVLWRAHWHFRRYIKRPVALWKEVRTGRAGSERSYSRSSSFSSSSRSRSSWTGSSRRGSSSEIPDDFGSVPVGGSEVDSYVEMSDSFNQSYATHDRGGRVESVLGSSVVSFEEPRPQTGRGERRLGASQRHTGGRAAKGRGTTRHPGGAATTTRSTSSIASFQSPQTSGDVSIVEEMRHSRGSTRGRRRSQSDISSGSSVASFRSDRSDGDTDRSGRGAAKAPLDALVDGGRRGMLDAAQLQGLMRDLAVSNDSLKHLLTAVLNEAFPPAPAAPAPAEVKTQEPSTPQQPRGGPAFRSPRTAALEAQHTRTPGLPPRGGTPRQLALDASVRSASQRSTMSGGSPLASPILPSTPRVKDLGEAHPPPKPAAAPQPQSQPQQRSAPDTRTWAWHEKSTREWLAKAVGVMEQNAAAMSALEQYKAVQGLAAQLRDLREELGSDDSLGSSARGSRRSRSVSSSPSSSTRSARTLKSSMRSGRSETPRRAGVDTTLQSPASAPSVRSHGSRGSRHRRRRRQRTSSSGSSKGGGGSMRRLGSRGSSHSRARRAESDRVSLERRSRSQWSGRSRTTGSRTPSSSSRSRSRFSSRSSRSRTRTRTPSSPRSSHHTSDTPSHYGDSEASSSSTAGRHDGVRCPPPSYLPVQLWEVMPIDPGGFLGPTAAYAVRTPEGSDVEVDGADVDAKPGIAGRAIEAGGSGSDGGAEAGVEVEDQAVGGAEEIERLSQAEGGHMPQGKAPRGESSGPDAPSTPETIDSEAAAQAAFLRRTRKNKQRKLARAAWQLAGLCREYDSDIGDETLALVEPVARVPRRSRQKRWAWMRDASDDEESHELQPEELQERGMRGDAAPRTPDHGTLPKRHIDDSHEPYEGWETRNILHSSSSGALTERPFADIGGSTTPAAALAIAGGGVGAPAATRHASFESGSGVAMSAEPLWAHGGRAAGAGDASTVDSINMSSTTSGDYGVHHHHHLAQDALRDPSGGGPAPADGGAHAFGDITPPSVTPIKHVDAGVSPPATDDHWQQWARNTVASPQVPRPLAAEDITPPHGPSRSPRDIGSGGTEASQAVSVPSLLERRTVNLGKKPAPLSSALANVGPKVAAAGGGGGGESVSPQASQYKDYEYGVPMSTTTAARVASLLQKLSSISTRGLLEQQECAGLSRLLQGGEGDGEGAVLAPPPAVFTANEVVHLLQKLAKCAAEGLLDPPEYATLTTKLVSGFGAPGQSRDSSADRWKDKRDSDPPEGKPGSERDGPAGDDATGPPAAPVPAAARNDGMRPPAPRGEGVADASPIGLPPRKASGDATDGESVVIGSAPHSHSRSVGSGALLSAQVRDGMRHLGLGAGGSDATPMSAAWDDGEAAGVLSSAGGSSGMPSTLHMSAQQLAAFRMQMHAGGDAGGHRYGVGGDETESSAASHTPGAVPATPMLLATPQVQLRRLGLGQGAQDAGAVAASDSVRGHTTADAASDASLPVPDIRMADLEGAAADADTFTLRALLPPFVVAEHHCAGLGAVLAIVVCAAATSSFNMNLLDAGLACAAMRADQAAILRDLRTLYETGGTLMAPPPALRARDAAAAAKTDPQQKKPPRHGRDDGLVSSNDGEEEDEEMDEYHGSDSSLPSDPFDRIEERLLGLDDDSYSSRDFEEAPYDAFDRFGAVRSTGDSTPTRSGSGDSEWDSSEYDSSLESVSKPSRRVTRKIAVFSSGRAATCRILERYFLTWARWGTDPTLRGSLGVTSPPSPPVSLPRSLAASASAGSRPASAPHHTPTTPTPPLPPMPHGDDHDEQDSPSGSGSASFGAAVLLTTSPPTVTDAPPPPPAPRTPVSPLRRESHGSRGSPSADEADSSSDGDGKDPAGGLHRTPHGGVFAPHMEGGDLLALRRSASSLHSALRSDDSARFHPPTPVYRAHADFCGADSTPSPTQRRSSAASGDAPQLRAHADFAAEGTPPGTASPERSASGEAGHIALPEAHQAPQPSRRAAVRVEQTLGLELEGSEGEDSPEHPPRAALRARDPLGTRVAGSEGSSTPAGSQRSGLSRALSRGSRRAGGEASASVRSSASYSQSPSITPTPSELAENSGRGYPRPSRYQAIDDGDDNDLPVPHVHTPSDNSAREWGRNMARRMVVWDEIQVPSATELQMMTESVPGTDDSLDSKVSSETDHTPPLRDDETSSEYADDFEDDEDSDAF